MSIEHKLKKVDEPGSPLRCQAVVKNGQCPFEKVEGAEYCQMHGGNSANDVAKAKSIRNYRLAKWQERINEKADNEAVKSLREEIGILRMILEETVNKCKDEYDLVINSGKISDLVMKVEKVVSSCNRLESHLGLMIDKTAALQLSGEMVEIIGRYIKDEDAIDSISNAIGEAVMRAGKVKLDESE